MQTVNEMLVELENAVLDAFEVDTASLPNFKGRAKKVSLRSLRAKLDKPEVDPRDISAKFEKKKIKQGSRERLAALEKYRKDIEEGRAIDYDTNERKLNNNSIAFAKTMVRIGILSNEDFE